MTAIVSAYAKSAGLRRRCAYCGLLVGVVVWIDGEREYERYVKTDSGPVCGDCIKHYEQVRAAYERDKANSVRLREAKRGRRGMRNPFVRTHEEVLAAQMKQAEVIWKGLAEGKSQGHIARNLGIARSTVQKRIKKFGRAACPST